MIEKPYEPPRSAISLSRLLRFVIRLSLIATYPLLALSMLLLASMGFGAAFIVDFAIENRTDQSIVVTPIGTVGKQGQRTPLPVYRWRYPAIPASQRGGFDLQPGESVRILYDMDDVNFSEIVVRDVRGATSQLVVNPNPTVDQYRAPRERHFVIDESTDLQPVPVSVLAASNTAQLPTVRPWIILGLLILPWGMYALLSTLNRIASLRLRSAGVPN